MRKIFTFLFAALMSVGMWAEPVTVVFAANNKTVEKTVTLPHTFKCDWAAGMDEPDELDNIIVELYNDYYYCDNNINASGSDQVEVGTEEYPQNDYITIKGVFESTATVTGGYIDGEYEAHNYTLTISVKGGSTPEPEPEPEPDSETLATNKGDASYTGTHFSVTPNAGQLGDSDGFYVTSTDHATISALNGETILSVELTVGAGEQFISYFGASKGDVSHSGSLITISDVNATSVELLMTYMSALQIKQVKIYYAEAPAPTPVTDPITPYEDPDHAGVYYSTFYDSNFKYALPAGVEAYVATLDGANLLLSKIADAGQTIPADNAVILKSTVTPFTLTPSDAAAVPVNAINHLQGTDVSIATPANCYVLAGTDGVVGFYHYTAANLNAHKAYVVFSGSNNAPRRMPFIFDAATGVENVQGNVQSTKVIENGVLYIIKNGVKYNAQGQIVK